MRSAATFLAIALAISAVPARATDIVTPTFTGPIAEAGEPGNSAHNYPFFASNHDLAAHGYVEEEYFLAGAARRYDTPDLATGKVLDGDHPYKTRLVVRRPADPARFNGVVLVEWLNVTNGFDADNAWFFSWEHMLRAGYAWVGVSAQKVGVDRLKAWSPTRYGTLDVTEGGKISNDALSYDIFAQVGDTLRHPENIDLLHGLHPKQVIAIGESQSAIRLASYINSVDPLNHVYDGFLLLSAFGRQIRPDPVAPVFKVSTEYDVQAGDAGARQPDGPHFRAWEVAGTSHVDQHLRASREPLELRDFGTSSEAELAPTCAHPDIGTRVPTSDALAAAYDLLSRWIATNTPPPSAPKIETASIGAPVSTPAASGGTFALRPAVLARDASGLAKGGIRLAAVQVPVGLDVGTNIGPGACVRWGYDAPYDVVELNALYPTHAAYVEKVMAATQVNLRAGYMLPADAQNEVDAAKRSGVGVPARH